MSDHFLHARQRLATAIRSARENLGYTLETLASVSATAASVISDAENAKQTPTWRFVDSLSGLLDAAGQHERSVRLVQLRSLAEAPHLGAPGTLTLCFYPGDADWHWVRRRRGQLYCPEHGNFLVGVCYSCGTDFAACTEDSTFCPGCGPPISALAENADLDTLRDLGLTDDSFGGHADASGPSSGSKPTVGKEQAPTRLQRRSVEDEALHHNVELNVDSPDQLGGRARLHYDAAFRLAAQSRSQSFGRAELIAVCAELAPKRPSTSVLPSDYCVGAKGQAHGNPWFLAKRRRGQYVFVGLNGKGDDLNPPSQIQQDMNATQPNPTIKTPQDLNRRDREHYEVARSLAGPFKRATFLERYHEMYPTRNPGSIIPSDYCFNRENRGNATYPRFLLYDEDRCYRFVGLGGDGAPGLEPSSSAPPEPSVTSPRRSPRVHQASARKARFRPAPDAEVRLDPQTAKDAIVAYNQDPTVLGQEQRAFESLGQGLRHGEVHRQLRDLDQAYSTRSVHKDLDVIASSIESNWERWSTLLAQLTPLSDEVPDVVAVSELMGFFLSQETRRKPRSLATKSLHFAAPSSFIPADSYAADLLGSELGAGSWSDTSGTGSKAFAAWYRDYLQVIHDIHRANVDLIAELLELDAETFRLPGAERMRGLPKVLDKTLWWVALQRSKGHRTQIFLRGS